MAWRLKTKEPEIEPQKVIPKEIPQDNERFKPVERPRAPEIDEEEELKEKLRLIEEKKRQPERNIVNKQELIDAIQGNISRAMQLIEILRGN